MCDTVDQENRAIVVPITANGCMTKLVISRKHLFWASSLLILYGKSYFYIAKGHGPWGSIVRLKSYICFFYSIVRLRCSCKWSDQYHSIYLYSYSLQKWYPNIAMHDICLHISLIETQNKSIKPRLMYTSRQNIKIL